MAHEPEQDIFTWGVRPLRWILLAYCWLPGRVSPISSPLIFFTLFILKHGLCSSALFIYAEGSNKFGASFETPFGNRMVKPAQYMESISALRPNLWSSLPDEVPAWVSDKRNKLSVDRTTRWLDECLALRPMDEETALGSIVGGTSLEERIRSAQDIARRNVSGFWLGGFGLGESVEERPALLEAVIGILPEGKPRSISGIGLPEEVLQGVAAGVDIFDSTYPHLLTIGGYAMTFPLNMDNNVIKASHMELSDMGADSSKINLRATIYRNDASPLMEGCTCYTCQRHTKAYIHHLLCTHEMLEQTLLEMYSFCAVYSVLWK